MDLTLNLNPKPSPDAALAIMSSPVAPPCSWGPWALPGLLVAAALPCPVPRPELLTGSE